MDEWQPARLRKVHPLNEERNKVLYGPIVRIRRDVPNFSRWRTVPKCDAELFHIHPDDVRRLAPWIDMKLWTCKCEILTD